MTAEMKLGSRLMPLMKSVTLAFEVLMSVVHLLTLGSGGGVGRVRRCDCMFKVPGSIGGLLCDAVVAADPELEEDDLGGGFRKVELDEFDLRGGFRKVELDEFDLGSGFMKLELEEDELLGGLSGGFVKLELVAGCCGRSLGE